MRTSIFIIVLGTLTCFLLLPCKEETKNLPDITQQAGLLSRDTNDQKIINEAAENDDPVSYLNQKYGSDTLESRIRYWYHLIGCDLSPTAKISLVSYVFTDKDTVRQQIKNPNNPSKIDTLEGLITGHRLFVSVTNDPKYNGERMLLCMNGMIGNNPVASRGEVIQHGEINDGVQTIESGGSICGTLKMTWRQAQELAIREGLKYYWKKGRFYVLIHPGDQFVKTNGVWHLDRNVG